MVVRVYLKKHHSTKKKTINFFSYIFLIAGSLLLFWSFYPILSSMIYNSLFLKNNINTPLSKQNGASALTEANSIFGASNILSNNLRDYYTRASVWFPASPQLNQLSQLTVKEYDLSIPKLNIKKARVVVGGEDLTKSLVHYLPKSLPGEYGNVAIFGHSTIRQYYNPKDYKTIFTFLDSLDKGDKIYVNIGELEYQYEVTTRFIVKPSEISVLEQKKDASYLTLITCTPPGTYLERLVVTAKLTQL